MVAKMAVWAALLLLCAMLHVVVPDDAQVVRRRYAHLQVEIDAWRQLTMNHHNASPEHPNLTNSTRARRVARHVRETKGSGFPEVAEFHHRGSVTTRGWLFQLPKMSSIFFNDYEANVLFYLFTRENPNQRAAVPPTVRHFRAAGYNASRPTKIVVHGFTNNIDSDVFNFLVPALMQQGDYNVVGVDWGRMAAAPFYVEARNHVDGVGARVASLADALALEAGLEPDSQLHCLGHSLGAHVCGVAGKRMSTGKPARITGMDPAMPLFLTTTSDRLSRDDAHLVDVVHTCAGMLGLEERLGHADFYVNGGSRPQPGCGLDLTGACSHSRSFQYIAESARDGPDAFPAVQCGSVADAEVPDGGSGACGEAAVGNMGLDLRFDLGGSGAYFLQTAASSPFDMSAHTRAWSS